MIPQPVSIITGLSLGEDIQWGAGQDSFYEVMSLFSFKLSHFPPFTCFCLAAISGHLTSSILSPSFLYLLSCPTSQSYSLCTESNKSILLKHIFYGQMKRRNFTAIDGFWPSNQRCWIFLLNQWRLLRILRILIFPCLRIGRKMKWDSIPPKPPPSFFLFRNSPLPRPSVPRFNDPPRPCSPRINPSSSSFPILHQIRQKVHLTI